MEHTKIYYFLNVNTHIRCVRDVIMMGSGNGHRPSQLCCLVQNQGCLRVFTQ